MHLQVKKPLSSRSALLLKSVSILIPLGLWCLISYVPWIWHPQVLIVDSGDSMTYLEDQRLEKKFFHEEQASLQRAGETLMVGVPCNPAYAPAPHEVFVALYTAITSEPELATMPTFMERIGSSLLLLFQGVLLASVIAIPLGLACGTFDAISKLTEPFIDFFRYMPAPAFGALMVGIFGMFEAPKIAIIFIGLFFNMLLITANTARALDTSLLEAAQTLGAKRHQLVWRVVLPGVMPMVYNDLRITIGFGWVYLAVAELVGTMSGLTEFINQNSKFRDYPDAYAGILVFGIIGFATDQSLALLGRRLFPWHSREKRSWFRTTVLRIRAWRNDADALQQLRGRRLADVGA